MLRKPLLLGDVEILARALETLMTLRRAAARGNWAMCILLARSDYHNEPRQSSHESMLYVTDAGVLRAVPYLTRLYAWLDQLCAHFGAGWYVARICNWLEDMYATDDAFELFAHALILLALKDAREYAWNEST